MSKIIPFLFSNNIIRYLKTIIQTYESRKNDVLVQKQALPFECIIQNYVEGEFFTAESEENRKCFEEFFIQQEVAHIEDSQSSDYKLLENDAITFKNKNSTFFFKADGQEFPSHMRMVVLDINPFYEALNQYLTGAQASYAHLSNEEWNSNCKYNKKTGRVSFHEIQHSFQARKGGALRKQVFNFLWDSRRHTLNYGKEVVSSGSYKKIEDMVEYLRLPVNKESDIEKAIKNIRNELRSKHFPIEIKTKDKSYMLVVKEV